MPRSCGWQTRQGIGCYPIASSVPIENSAEFEMGVGRRLCAGAVCK
ncbi:MAG TPA: hypothetical protein OIL99_01305 [Clostridiales bacterium]|nr:hypothetical protein [Clostridiales bacterium]